MIRSTGFRAAVPVCRLPKRRWSIVPVDHGSCTVEAKLALPDELSDPESDRLGVCYPNGRIDELLRAYAINLPSQSVS